MDAAPEIGRDPVSKRVWRMSRLTRGGTAEPVSRDQILRRERGQRNIYFPYSADHKQDWQPYSVDPYSCYIYVMTILAPTSSFALGRGSDALGTECSAQITSNKVIY